MVEDVLFDVEDEDEAPPANPVLPIILCRLCSRSANDLESKQDEVSFISLRMASFSQ